MDNNASPYIDVPISTVPVYTIIITVNDFSCSIYSLRSNLVTDASVPHLVKLMETARKLETL